jgi:hypothetical protein
MTLRKKNHRRKEGFKHLGVDYLIILKHSFIHSLVFSPQAGLAGTRTQSGDRYGAGPLHPRHVLRGTLPLLSLKTKA